ncbi:MAG TPA: hypothetical protein VM934_11945 [Pyrinomonadaceae bacterium]|nr:hypothetical protein [Pyrinomonadaceae bacterium]
MKRARRIAALLVAGFLAFAPPGTLIFGFLLIAGLLRHCTNTADDAKRAPQQRPAAESSPSPGATPSSSPRQ